MSGSYAQSQARSTLNLSQVSDGVDLLIELGQLRRAYTSLEGNFSLYKGSVQVLIKQAVDEVVASKDGEIKHWKVAYEQENAWYNNKFLWLGMGVASTVIIIIAAGAAQ